VKTVPEKKMTFTARENSSGEKKRLSQPVKTVSGKKTCFTARENSWVYDKNPSFPRKVIERATPAESSSNEFPSTANNLQTA
jgi:hypothetical protein